MCLNIWCTLLCTCICLLFGSSCYYDYYFFVLFCFVFSNRAWTSCWDAGSPHEPRHFFCLFVCFFRRSLRAELAIFNLNFFLIIIIIGKGKRPNLRCNTAPVTVNRFIIFSQRFKHFHARLCRLAACHCFLKLFHCFLKILFSFCFLPFRTFFFFFSSGF